jgi:1-acyl-sn-glycerol-3-phosphate acyltransferase
VLYHLFYAFFWLILRPVLALLGGIRIDGVEQVPREGGLILTPNHGSYADPLILGMACPRVIWWMTKKHLFKIPLLGPIMRIFHAFPVDVEHFDREALRFSEELVRKGEVLCIFPEGGVSDDGRLLPLKPGLGLIALRTGAPVLPVALVRTHRFFPPTGWLPRFVPGGVEVRFGAPIPLEQVPTDISRREQSEWITARVRDALLTLLPEEHHPE